MNGQWKYDIMISPDSKGGEYGEHTRGVWTASVARRGEIVSYDGSGSTIEEALCDLIDNLAGEVLS
jgi:hypothetical protein